MTYLVSVIIPVFNRPVAVQKSIKSVLDQDIDDCEIIIVDDGSDDKIFSEYHDHRIKVIRHDKNLGAAFARNTGINAGRGKYIAFLDSDDVWLPGKLESQIKFMEQGRYKASCTGFNLRRISSENEVTKSYNYTQQNLDDIIWGCHLSPGSTLMVERDIYKDIGLYDEKFKRYEDWDWLLRFCGKYEIGLLPTVLSRIILTGVPDDRDIEQSLKLISDKYKTLLDGTHIKKLKAAVCVELAAQAYRKERYIFAIYYILNSLFICPISNVAVKKVILPRIFSSEITIR